MSCLQCADKGLIRINYQSGELFDVAICSCWRGQFYRKLPDDAIRNAFVPVDQVPLPEAHRIGLLEDFDEATVTTAAPDFTAAVRRQKRAKL